MNRTRNGRIARLPRAIRDELNRRLDEGEPGKSIVAWLNALPEVVAISEAEHEGRPIREQNLSEWRKGGYADWQARQQVLEIADRLTEDAEDWSAEKRAPLADTLAHWAAGQYAIATREIAASERAETWQHLRDFCRDLVELRKGDHSAERLRIERERLELERLREEERTEADFWEWAQKPENRERICQGFHSAPETIGALRALFFGPHDEADSAENREKIGRNPKSASPGKNSS